MTRAAAAGVFAVATMLALGQVRLEQPDLPPVSNARVETRSAAAGLEAAIAPLLRGGQAAWVGYAVPTASKCRMMCCFESWRGSRQCSTGCQLERDKGTVFNSDAGSCVRDEPWSEALVLLRIEGGKIGRVRSFTPECPLDAGGLPFHWLTEVKAAESIALLRGLALKASAAGEKRLAGGALHAIALHDDEAADRVLEEFLSASQPLKVRKDAAFWAGMERGRRGFDVLRRLAQREPDDKMREHLAFVFSQNGEPEAVHELIRLARQDASQKVRGQALFWMAQRAGREMASELERAVNDDPGTEVKRKAVFALSQLPKEEGVPLLIKLARTHRNPAVRKEAIFWLGQAEDPRAMAFLEEVLLRK